jgi:hypothetical protein
MCYMFPLPDAKRPVTAGNVCHHRAIGYDKILYVGWTMGLPYPGHRDLGAVYRPLPGKEMIDAKIKFNP